MCETRVVLREDTKRPLAVERAVYRGQERVDIRWQYWNEAQDLRPTRQGISLSLELAAEVAETVAGLRNGESVILDQEAREPLVVQHTVYRGQQRLDIRRHYWQAESLKPGKRGISLPVGDGFVGTVLEAVKELLGERAAV